MSLTLALKLVLLIGNGEILCSKVTDGISALSFSLYEEILQEYGSNGTLYRHELEAFLNGQISKGLVSANENGDLTRVPDAKPFSTNVTSQDFSNVKCVTLKDVFELYELEVRSEVNQTILNDMSLMLLYVLTHTCDHGEQQEADIPPSQLSVWGYGFLMVTVINLCSLVGVLVLPFMRMAVYKEILIFMVALAVGALAGSGLLFLIPEAFGLVSEEDGSLMYVYKASTVMGGIYLFYLTEKIMRMVTKWKESRNMQLKQMSKDEDESRDVMDIICSVKKQTPMSQDMMYKETSTLPSTLSSSCTHQELLEKSSDESNCARDQNTSLMEPTEIEHTPVSFDNQRQQVIKPLAWMIIFGDGLHNFIDGLSIGTAFTQSTLAGISVSVAVMCEELPHELGDFAILLNCGMSVKKALLYNFMSACMCYIGLILGIMLGENTSSHDWVFAIAGGMFLYISLADMMPEMNSASETQGVNKEKQIFIIQNLGLLLGFGIMLILAIYGSHINFE